MRASPDPTLLPITIKDADSKGITPENTKATINIVIVDADWVTSVKNKPKTIEIKIVSEANSKNSFTQK